MHRFDSGRRLQFSSASFLALFVGFACHDPPTPPPTQGPDDLPRWSLAPHVSWSGLTHTAARPLAVFVDDPGGPLDRIAADADVTTFLNDRFTPIFLIPERAPLARGVSFLDGDGCVLLGPIAPATPEAFIDIANDLQVRLAAGVVSPVHVDAIVPPQPLSLPPESPLRLACAPARR
jgi:hypothetical protein